MGKTNQKPPKTLNPRPAPAAANLDVLIAVDGSSSLKGPDFDQEKRIINALAARMGQGSQLGVIQFGSTAQIISSLTTDMSELEAKVANMAQIGGGTNLLQALEHCHTEFGLSKFPKNSKQIWIVTDGGYDQPKPTALYATKIAREKQATIYGIGVGKGVTQASLNQVCSLQCAYMVEDFEHAVKIMKADVEKDLYMQLHAEIVFKEEIPLKLGQETFIRLEITNHGRKPLLAGSKIIFKGNDYFREKFAVLPENINPGEDLTLEDVKLVPKIKGNRANLDSQILSLPPLLEVSAQDNTGHEIYLDCTGFYLNHEDFSGDIYQYTPVYPEFPLANIITFGPPGAGKVYF